MTSLDFIHTLLHNTNAAARRRAAEDLMARTEDATQVIAAFAQGLNDTDKGVRDICGLGLVQTYPNLAIEKAKVIVPLIANANIEIRNLAGDILLKLGRAAAPALYPFLKAEKADDRKFACDIIGLLGDAASAKEIASLLHDGDPNVCCAAIEALGYLKAEEVLGDIIKLYDKEDYQPYVITAVGNIGGHAAQTFLLEQMNQVDPFLQMTIIDALSACADDISIADALLERLSDAETEVQLLLLKAAYAIAFRLNVAISLPDEYRDIAHQAMMDDEPETRVAGLLALGPMFYESDIPALLHEIQNNIAETQKHILYIVLSRSPAITVSIFFNKIFDALNGNCIQIVDLFGQIVSIWGVASPTNAEILLETMTRQYPNIPSDYQKEVVELLLFISRERLVVLLHSELQSNHGQRVEDALAYIDSYSIRELAEEAKRIAA